MKHVPSLGVFGARAALAGLLGVTAACTTQKGENVASVDQRVAVALTMTFPAGVNRLDAVLNASNSIKLGDRVQLLNNAGLPAALSNSGPAKASLGVEASVGRIFSTGPVELRAQAVVKDVISSSTSTKQGGVKVQGAETASGPLLVHLRRTPLLLLTRAKGARVAASHTTSGWSRRNRLRQDGES